MTRVFDIADQMQPYALRKKVTRVLEGAILGNMFFEASTRTRVVLVLHSIYWVES